MKERIKQLIEEYKGILEALREEGKTAIAKGNESEVTKLLMVIFYLEDFIEELEELLTL